MSLGGARKAFAQSNPEVDRAVAAMTELQATYAKRPLAFDVKYTYSNEHSPDVLLDSLYGKIEVSGTDSRCLLGNTETIHNSRYTILLFGEDKIMYLAKSGSTGYSTDPLQLIKTVLEKAGMAGCEVADSNQYKTIHLTFRQDVPFRQMLMTIDTTTGHLSMMRYVVKTALLTGNTADDEAVKEQGYDEYAIVQAVFDHYREVPPQPSRFSEQTFFYREGNDFKVTQAYRDYKIFIGSPNL
jgi:hypothetical protein